MHGKNLLWRKAWIYLVNRVSDLWKPGIFIQLSPQNQLQSAKDLHLGYLDCSGTDLSSAAGNLEEVAELIEEVGMERLRQFLGINTSLDFEL